MAIEVYMIKVSISIMLFYFLYRLVFKNFTFFFFNRFYLLSALTSSFLLPLFHIPERKGNGSVIDYSMGIDWEQFMFVSALPQQAEAASSVHVFTLIMPVCLAIAVFRLFRGLGQYYIIRKTYSGGFIEVQNGIRLNVHPLIRSPFTMFRTVYLDRFTYEQVNSPVLSHEMVHARQLHSVDLLLSEIICALLWFNPFVFLFKRQIRENHEFLADNAAIGDRQDLVSYMQALSSELTRIHDPAFASFFKSSTIKKRIIMLTTNKSKNSKKCFYFTVVPIIGFLLMAFQQPIEEVITEAPFFQLEKGNTASFPNILGSGIPSGLPLDEQYLDAITFDYNKEAKHPVTGEMMTHKGIDFRAPKGAAVYATGDGIVEKSEYHEKYGKVIVIKHGVSFQTLYAHLNDLLVSEGSNVKKGDQIGTVGNTGLSTGDHLHYEVRKDGENVNPADYF